jgi:hypothetical protein
MKPLGGKAEKALCFWKRAIETLIPTLKSALYRLDSGHGSDLFTGFCKIG